MNAMTKNWVPIGNLEDIPLRGARCVKNGDMTIAIFRTADNKVFAVEDKFTKAQVAFTLDTFAGKLAQVRKGQAVPGGNTMSRSQSVPETARAMALARPDHFGTRMIVTRGSVPTSRSRWCIKSLPPDAAMSSCQCG